MSSFCRECIQKWKQNTIMDCDICKEHLAAGWNIEKLLQVYGKKRKEMDHLGWEDIMIYPPSPNRPFLSHIEYPHFNLLKIENITHILNTVPYLTNVQRELKPLADHFTQFRQPENKEQYKAFLKQEMRIIYLYNMMTTYQTKQLVWDAMDPFTQHVIFNTRETSIMR